METAPPQSRRLETDLAAKKLDQMSSCPILLVKCGGRILDWNYIVRVSAFLALTPWAQCLNMGLHELGDRDYSNNALPLYLYSNSKMASLEEYCGLLYCLTKGRRFQCSDPKDKVYSLLGLLGNHTKGKPPLRPVYADRSVVGTYVFTAIKILEDADNLLLLAHVGGQDFQIVEGLPSWVPDRSCMRGLDLGIVGVVSEQAELAANSASGSHSDQSSCRYDI